MARQWYGNSPGNGAPRRARCRPDVYARRTSTLHGRPWMGLEIGGLFGLIILILDVYAIVKTLGSRASTGSKVLWIVVILVLPLLGLILWALFGPKG